jgi:hypothetical protein
MDVKEPPFHYLLVPVVQISKGNFEIRPIEQGLAALKVERSEHPILFSQITQLRRMWGTWEGTWVQEDRVE